MGLKTMNKVQWEVIKAFSSPHEYWRFQHWLNEQVEKGHATEIPLNISTERLPLFIEKHYQCDDGRVWVLTAPDFPFRGSWQPLTGQLNTVRWEVINGFNSYDEYEQFVKWLSEQVEKGYATKMFSNGYTFKSVFYEWEAHYQCDDGQVWVLSAPDYPLRGSWRPLKTMTEFPDKPDRLFAKPQNPVPDFAFNHHVAQVFNDMIRRSVPGYPLLVEQIGLLAARFAQANSLLYDLGCSLGAVTSELRKVKVNSARVIAVDNSAAMLERCSANLTFTTQDNPLLPVELIQADILQLKLQPASVVVMNFTLQFIAPEKRLYLLKRIRQSLMPGGVLILSEKLRFTDKNPQQLLTELHLDFKRQGGYSELEIAQKRDALENVMQPDSLEIHKNRLKEAGFSQVVPWFQCLNFGSILAVA